jgi:hypothetical protein
MAIAFASSSYFLFHLFLAVQRKPFSSRYVASKTPTPAQAPESDMETLSPQNLGRKPHPNKQPLRIQTNQKTHHKDAMRYKKRSDSKQPNTS